MSAAPAADLDLDRAASLFRLAADPTRLAVVRLLAAAPSHVGALAAALGNITQPALSHHLALLRASGVVAAARDGKRRVYRLTDSGAAILRCAAALA